MQKTEERTAYLETILPRFLWLNCSAVDVNHEMCLKVEFPKDELSDAILLNPVDNETTVFEGHLKNESDVMVSLVITDESNRDNVTVRGL